MNLPGYEFLSAPLGVISLLHMVTLTLHFLAMNFLFGGLAVILLAGINDKWQNPGVQKYIKLLPSVMAATITLGVAPLLFLQLVYPRQVYSAAITSGWFWLGVVAAAIVAYYLLYAVSFRAKLANHKGVYLGLAAVCLTYISFIYSSVFSMAENPELTRAVYAAEQSGIQINPQVGSYILRWLHMILGALTVGGFFLGWVGKDYSETYRTGKRFFLWGMIGASVVGLSYIGTLGEFIRPFMRTPATWTLALAILLSAGALHLYFKKKFVPAAIVLLASMGQMVYARHTLRLIRLADYYDPSNVAIEPQWLMFAIFLICFAVAVMTVWYMFRLFFGSPQASQ